MERDPQASGPIVSGFAGAGFRIAGHVFPAGLLLTPDAAYPWEAGLLDALDDAALAPLLALDPVPEFILLGTGATLRRPGLALVKALEGRGIGIEPMDSRAAARAWGMLRAEGRWIGAALRPLDA